MDKQQKQKLIAKAYQLRKRFVEIFTKVGYGHLTTAFSEAEILVTLYYKIMRISQDSNKRDVFVLSKGHGAGMLFPIFEDLGLIPNKELEETLHIGHDFTSLQKLFVPGFEFYGGSLGIGLGMATGMALGMQLNRDERLVFCLVGDAECYEGSIWEAAMTAAHHNLNNLIVIVDRNNLGCSDFTENMCRLEPFEDKWKSFGWTTKAVDGHSFDALYEALKDARARKTVGPYCIIANTIKGKGLNSVSNMPLMHGYMPKGEAIKQVYENIGYVEE